MIRLRCIIILHLKIVPFQTKYAIYIDSMNKLTSNTLNSAIRRCLMVMLLGLLQQLATNQLIRITTTGLSLSAIVNSFERFLACILTFSLIPYDTMPKSRNSITLWPAKAFIKSVLRCLLKRR